MPYIEKLIAAKSISRIQISGSIKANAEFVEINLLYNAPEWHEYIGATPLQIHVDFGNNSIQMRTYNYEEEWHLEKILKDGEGDFKNPFKKGEMFDLVIEIGREQQKPKERFDPGRSIAVYKMRVNGIEMDYKGDFPAFTINWLRFDGQFDLSAFPAIEYMEAPPPIVTKRELEHLFYEGEQLCLSADIKGDENNPVEIYLFHDVNEFDEKVGDTLLRVEFFFTDAGVVDEYFNMWNYYHHLGVNGQNAENGQHNPLVEQKNQPYQLLLRITARGDKYEIVVNDGRAQSWDYTHLPGNIVVPPAYGVNWLTVTGQLENLKIGNESEKCLNAKSGQMPLPSNIKQVDPNRPLTMKDLITINGTIKKKAAGGGIQITVGLFHGNVEWHPFIGETVLQINITANNFQSGTYYNMEWKFKGIVVADLKKETIERRRPIQNDGENAFLDREEILLHLHWK